MNTDSQWFIYTGPWYCHPEPCEAGWLRSTPQGRRSRPDNKTRVQAEIPPPLRMLRDRYARNDTNFLYVILRERSDREDLGLISSFPDNRDSSLRPEW